MVVDIYPLECFANHRSFAMASKTLGVYVYVYVYVLGVCEWWCYLVALVLRCKTSQIL